MATWLLADLDNIICDFMGQLRSATEQGWQQSRPAHYRAILAALETALHERRALSEAQPSTPLEQRVAARSAEALAEPELSLALRWRLRPLLALVPSRSH